MKKNIILAGGLITAVLISNLCGFVRDGRELDNIRNNTLRLHILANSDTEYDQCLKLRVRDELLRSGILDGAENSEQAERIITEHLPEIISISEKTLRENGCILPVNAELVNMSFDERVYDNITMPSGEYEALRIEIGSAQGHNWWCVMYPPLCIPVACDVETDTRTAEVFFNEKQLDIIERPEKYRIRFAVWDGLKKILK